MPRRGGAPSTGGSAGAAASPSPSSGGNDFFIAPHPREADFFGVRVFRAEVAHAAKANLRRPDPSAQVQPAFVQPRPTPVYPAWHEAQRRRDVRRVL